MRDPEPWKDAFRARYEAEHPPPSTPEHLAHVLRQLDAKALWLAQLSPAQRGEIMALVAAEDAYRERVEAALRAAFIAEFGAWDEPEPPAPDPDEWPYNA